MTPKDPLFGGDFLGQILAADSLPGAFVHSRIESLVRDAFSTNVTVLQAHVHTLTGHQDARWDHGRRVVPPYML